METAFFRVFMLQLNNVLFSAETIAENEESIHKEGGEKTKKDKLKALDRSKVHKMHTAVRLNELILEHSSESQLVLLNLPKPPEREGKYGWNFSNRTQRRYIL